MKISDVKGLIGQEYAQILMKDKSGDYCQTFIAGQEAYKKKGDEALRNLAFMDAYPAQKGNATPSDVIATLVTLWTFSGTDVEKYAKILELYIIQFTEFVTKYAE